MRPLPRSLIVGLTGASVLALLLADYFSTPLARFGEVHFSAAERLQAYDLMRVETAPLADRAPLPDTITRIEPWSMLARDEFASGRLPLWNPWNGTGCPHLANHDAAVFSPYSLPFYVLSFKAALIASAFLKLFALGLFTFLFLMELRLSPLAAMLGAVAFVFAGHNALHVSFPDIGALVALPSGLFFAEKALRRARAVALHEPGERRARARVRGPLAGLTLSLTVGWLAGSAGSLLLALLFVSVWIAVRLIGIGCAVLDRKESVRPLRVFAAKTGLAYLLAAGFAAFQILPFLEYVQQGLMGGRRVGLPSSLEPSLWPLWLFPEALDDRSAAGSSAPGLAEGVEAAHLAYVGGIVLFLALLSLVFVRRDRRIGLFLLTSLGCLVGSVDVVHVAPLLAGLPPLGLEILRQTPGLFAFCTACAAALCVDHLLRRGESPAWFRALATALAGLAFLAVFRLGVQAWIDGTASSDSAGARISPHLRQMAEVFAAGIVATCLLWVARPEGLRRFAAGAMVLVVFLGGGWYFKDSHAVCEDRLYFPTTPAIAEIRRAVGHDRLAILGQDGLPPDTNIAYGIALLTGDDGIGIEEYARLLLASFGTADLRGPLQDCSERALRTFGVSWILARGHLPLLDAHPDAFQLTQRMGDFGLYRYRRSLGKYWTVRGSAVTEDAPTAIELQRAPSFDPAKVVVLGPDDQGSPPRTARDFARVDLDRELERRLGRRVADLPAAVDAPPKAVEETPTWIRIEADCSAPEFLVIAQAHYPGWRARVNGIEKPVYRANYAFSAIELQRGLNVVDFSYEPESLRIGLWIALASGLCGLVCLVHRPVS